MGVQLCEPFFLHGRRSVLQRAVVISSVLTGLGSLVGCSIAATLFVFEETNRSNRAIGWYVVFPVAWSVFSVAFVHGPLNAWNGRSRIWSLLALAAGFLLMLNFAEWTVHPYRIGQGRRTFFPILVVYIASGLLQVRFSRLHMLAYLISILGGILAPSLFVLLYSRSHEFSVGPLGMSSGSMSETINFAVLYGGWHASLSVPWGIPFWWPPKPDAPPCLPEPA